MRRRRHGCGCLTTLLALVLVGAVVFVVDYGGDYLLFAPWAYGFFGQPTLTGSWTGAMSTHRGVRYVVYLQLNRDRNRHGTALATRGQADIDGHASWCAHGIPNTTTTLFGYANRSASSIVLETNELRHPPPGLFPLDFRGAWHGSRLDLHVLFDLVQHHAYVYSSSIPDEVHPVRLTLHKEGYRAFQSACTRL